MALVPFVIDTGASRSCIHARDARDRFGARRSLLETLPWRQAVRIGGVGGAARALDVPAEFIFRHEDTRIESIFANVLIGDLSTENLPSPHRHGHSPEVRPARAPKQHHPRTRRSLTTPRLRLGGYTPSATMALCAATSWTSSSAPSVRPPLNSLSLAKTAMRSSKAASNAAPVAKTTPSKTVSPTCSHLTSGTEPQR